MANLSYIDQYILSQDETWRQRIKQATVATAFDLLQEDHSGTSYQGAHSRQELCQNVITRPDQNTDRIASILASQVPSTLVTTDGETVTSNDVTDAQLGGFVLSNWSKLAGVGSSLPDLS